MVQDVFSSDQSDDVTVMNLDTEEGLELEKELELPRIGFSKTHISTRERAKSLVDISLIIIVHRRGLLRRMTVICTQQKRREQTTMKNNAKNYRLPETTTPENLACDWSCTVNFGSKVLLAGYYYSGRNANSYFGAVYEYTTADHTCEGEIRLAAVSKEMFKDDGHALAWGMAQ